MFKLFKLLVITGLICFLFLYVLRPYCVNGNSMSNTINDGDYVLINCLDYNMNNIERFDIVVLDCDGKEIVKRVIGLPNEVIKYRDDQLYVNHIPVKEDFISDDYIEEMKNTYLKDYFTEDFSVELGDDEYFVLGDNRLESDDSRVYGTFCKDDIIGVNGLVVYPFEDFKFLD